MPPKEGQEEPLAKMGKIIHWLMAHEDTVPFREPVDWRGLELFDYPQVIKKMMDLGTIQRKYERDQYSTAWEVAQDIRLVWHNCMTYNAEGSDFWALANRFLRRFEDRFRKIRYEYDVGEDDVIEEDQSEGEEEDEEEEEELEFDDGDHEATARSGTPESTRSRFSAGGTPSLDARAQLARDLLALKGPELGYVMSLLEQECPDCLELEEEVPRHVELNLDTMPPTLFARIATYAAEQSTGRKRGVNPEEIKWDDVSGKRKRKR